MIEISERNVNRTLVAGIQLLKASGRERPSRNGPTIEVPEPVATVFRQPRERVLFSEERDANPFFHFFEALWMLAGRRDVAFVASLIQRMAEYSDDGVTQHGAYGHRWRRWPAPENGGILLDRDQLNILIVMLRKDPNTRRAVLSMWDPNRDLFDPPATAKDVPCNTTVYFKIRDGALMMTVCNRSNDALWGTFGANVVHMSMMQEYVAAKVGVGLGHYTQVSDSFHVYTDGPGGEVWDRVKHLDAFGIADPYMGSVLARPMEVGEAGWDHDLHTFFDIWDYGQKEGGTVVKLGVSFYTNWFNTVVIPMWNAYQTRDIAEARKIEAEDWRLAACMWLRRRNK